MLDLSVHLITYNNEAHIDETIQSILKQKVDFNYEIVIGDDCSTDNTLNIVNAYKTKHPNMFNVRKNKSQLGILKNFKATLDRCNGKYVFDIAGDDLLKNEFTLQKMVEVLKKNDNLGFVDSGYDTSFETKKTDYFSNQEKIEASKNDYKNNLILGKIVPIGICYNRKHLYDFVDFDSYLEMNITIEDYPILTDLVMHTNFETINESLHIYRVHDDSYSHKKTFENHSFLNTQMKTLFDYFSKKYNYSKNINETFYRNHYKHLLFLAGYFEEKDIGKDTFKKIESKNIKDYIHYLASQSSIFRKLISAI